MFGAPRPDEANWCTGCKLTLKILDSVIENAVTDPIQFSNSGTNSELSLEIRNTKVRGGNPRQGGGGISLNAQGGRNSGGSTTLLVEDSDVIGTTGYGITVNDAGDRGGHTVTVDLGGGVLGSRGHNRFIDNEKGTMRIPMGPISAQYNWWNGDAPTVYGSDDQPTEAPQLLVAPMLSSDPR